MKSFSTFQFRGTESAYYHTQFRQFSFCEVFSKHHIYLQGISKLLTLSFANCFLLFRFLKVLVNVLCVNWTKFVNQRRQWIYVFRCSHRMVNLKNVSKMRNSSTYNTCSIYFSINSIDTFETLLLHNYSSFSFCGWIKKGSQTVSI